MPSRDEAVLLDLAQRLLACPPRQAPSLLRRLGFADPERASQALDRLAGPPQELTPPGPELVVALARSARPDRALRHLERLVDIWGGRNVLYRRFAEDPALCDGVVRLMAHSNFMADILVRDPEWLYWLFEETEYLDEDFDKPVLRRTLRAEIAGAGGPDGRLRRLRRLHRRELLRIGAAEVLGRKSVGRIGRELADLADVVVEICLDTVQSELLRAHGRPVGPRGERAHFCVVALGKHGGQELNYSSDIDLLLIYDEDGETVPGLRGAALSNVEFFTQLGKRLLQVLGEVTPEGFFYRVDMRLRPEGAAGPLVRSLRAYWTYYESRGELWERQMLLKARRAAGNPGVWRRFVRMIEGFVFPGHFVQRPQDEIRRIKERIENEIGRRPHGDNNIKLQAGGIRDIEFVVQCLQLLRGRIDRKVRAHNTLDAVERLERVGALKRAEAESLRRAYCFWRRVENLLQIEDGRSSYAVPEDRTGRRGLAFALGMGAAAFNGARRRHGNQVRKIYDGLFYNEAVAETLDWVVESEPGVGSGCGLRRFGFEDGDAAHRHVWGLANGMFVSEAARERLRQAVAHLLASLGAAPDPDEALVRFSQVVEAYGAPGILFEMLQSQPSFMRLLTVLCGSSPFLAELVRREPWVLDALLHPGAGTEEWREAGRQGDMGAVGRLYRQEILRIGVEDLLGVVPTAETFMQLAELAETVLRMAYAEAMRQAVRRRGRPRDRHGRPATLAVMAAGKFGGGELGFGSDLDLFFVYEGEGQTGRSAVANSEFFAEVAQGVGQLLVAGGMPEVDARLRPEGGSAPLAISLPAYRRYLVRRGATWERLALTRARQVAGDPALGTKVLRAIHRFCFGGGVDVATVDEIRGMRRRLEPAAGRRPPAVDIKRGPGGIVDIEFVAQTLALRWGRGQRDLRQPNTWRLLESLGRRGHLEARETRHLQQAYGRLRDIEKALRIGRARADNVLPVGAGLEVLARAVGAEDGDSLAEELAALMRQTRQHYERLMARLAAQQGQKAELSDE